MKTIVRLKEAVPPGTDDLVAAGSRLEEEGGQPMAGIIEARGLARTFTTDGVVLAAGGLIGAAKAHQVGDDGAVPSLDEDRDHLSVQVAPRGLAVYEKQQGQRLLAVPGAIAGPEHARVPAAVADRAAS